MNKVQTDNSYFDAKVKLRIDHLPNKKSLNVLDLFGGDGLIWNEIIKQTGKNISVLRMDVKSDKPGVYLKGDNTKFLKLMDLKQFDIIDVDAYGVPFKQLKIIFQKKYKGLIFITYIQSVFGRLPKQMLFELNYTERMIQKIPTMFNRDGIEKLKNWMSLYSIKKCKRISFQNKHYLVINY